MAGEAIWPVLAANRNPVADPMPAETMFPLSELDRMLPLSDTALHTAAGSERGRRSSRPIGLFERNASNFKGTRNTKAQKSWSSRAEPEVRIHLPPALSHVRTRLPRSAGWLRLRTAPLAFAAFER